MKYAIATINQYINEKGNVIPRKILIEYTSLEIIDTTHIYRGVRVLKADPYFTDGKKHSYSYCFGSNYILAEDCRTGITIEKLYHSTTDPLDLGQGGRYYLANEFECDDDDSAILRFELG